MLDQMKEWLKMNSGAEGLWANAFDNLTDEHVLKAIEYTYEGGVEQFINDTLSI